MNAEWQSRFTFPKWLKIILLLLLLVGIGICFSFLESDRTRTQRSKPMQVHRGDDGAIHLVRFEADEVTERQWEKIRPAQATLRTLHLSRTKSVAGGLAAAGEFPNLETLTLIGCDWVDDEQMEQLAGLELTHLNLARTPITDRGLAAIDLSRLQFLNLNGCRGVTDAGIDLLHSGDSLTNVSLAGTSITLDGFERLRTALPEAQLRVSKSALLRTAFRTVNDAPWLETPEDVEALLGIHRLPHDWYSGESASTAGSWSIDLRGPAAGPALPGVFAALPKLKSLTLVETTLPGVFDSAPSSLSSLTIAAPSGDVDLSVLESMDSLTSLKISQTTISKGQLAMSARLSSLRQLTLDEVSLPNGELKSLRLLPSLDHVGLRGMIIAEFDLLTIAECESLRSVRLTRIPVSDAVARAVAVLPNLTQLVLDRTTVSPEVLEEIRIGYPHLRFSSTTMVSPGVLEEMRSRYPFLRFLAE